MNFNNAYWIWNHQATGNNIYVDFYDNFSGNSKQNYTLYISAHTQYAIYLNSVYIPASQFADYEDYQIYDEVDISPYVREGNNELKIVCYYFGQDSSATKNAIPGLIYMIKADNTILAASSPKCQTSINPHYKSHDCPFISGQLGYSFVYDNNITEQPIQNNADIQKKEKCLFPRPIKPLTFENRMPATVISQGFFNDTKKLGDNLVGTAMWYAALSFRPHFEISSCPESRAKLPCNGITYKAEDGYDGIYLILDLHKESTGLIELDFDVDDAARVYIGVGEHLQDMRVRTEANTHQYAAVYYAHKGSNKFLHPFRRYGLKYIQLHIYAKKATIKYVGIRSTLYPVSKVPFFKSCDNLHNKIYEVCVNTLIQCMHEHYEDCPTREQALYTMDSRNQMLCGYYAFGEYTFAKSSLRLIAKSIRQDNMLELCSPGKVAITIPAFSAIFLTQIFEYLLYSGDTVFVKEELLPTAKKIAHEFISRTNIALGLLYEFKEEYYWNFYEWRPGLEGSIAGSIEETDLACSAPLTAFVSAGLRDLAKTCKYLCDDEADYFETKHLELNKAFDKTFWDDTKGIYASFLVHDKKQNWAQLTQSLAIWADVCIEKPEKKATILKALAENKDLIPVTPSSTIFKYEALLTDAETYGRFVFLDIAKEWGNMLYDGATTFWETFVGADDFGGAGSLCHAWSAVPVYFYFAYALGIKPESIGFDIKEQKKIISGLYDCRGRIQMPDSTQITFN